MAGSDWLTTHYVSSWCILYQQSRLCCTNQISPAWCAGGGRSASLSTPLDGPLNLSNRHGFSVNSCGCRLLIIFVDNECQRSVAPFVVHRSLTLDVTGEVNLVMRKVLGCLFFFFFRSNCGKNKNTVHCANNLKVQKKGCFVQHVQCIALLSLNMKEN